MAKPSKKGPETTVKVFCAGCKQYLYKYRKVSWTRLQAVSLSIIYGGPFIWQSTMMKSIPDPAYMALLKDLSGQGLAYCFNSLLWRTKNGSRCLFRAAKYLVGRHREPGQVFYWENSRGHYRWKARMSWMWSSICSISHDQRSTCQ